MIILYSVPISLAYAGQGRKKILLGTLTIMTVDINSNPLNYQSFSIEDIHKQ